MIEVATPDEAIARAKRETGFSSFGGDSFLEGLSRSVAALQSLPLTGEALQRTEASLVQDLANRLRIEDYYRQHPELEAETVDGPVVVTGLPRTGTTATVALLALDPRFRFPRAWEARAPIPPPEFGAEQDDPRAIAARAAAKSYELATMHLSDPDGPEEDMFLLAGLDCRSYRGDLPMPDDYLGWWMSDNFATTYAYHHRVLRLLQSKRPPNRWLLKSPTHLFRPDAVVCEYPDARFIMTHRDPGTVISSVASFSSTLYERACLRGSAVLNKQETGRRCLSFWAEGMRRGLAARAAIGEDRFIDVLNRDIVRSPIETLERVYDQLGMSTSAELRAKWAAYQAKNVHNAIGAHQHSPEDFGLSAAAVRLVFKDYCERFGV